MKVFLNQQEIFVGSRVTLRDLLAGQSEFGDNAVVAVNNCVILKHEWHNTMLSNNDQVVIIRELPATAN